MANTTVSIRERIKTEGRWRWSQNLRPPDDKLVWPEGKKREQRVKGKFEAAVKAARAKERHLEDAADATLCQGSQIVPDREHFWAPKPGLRKKIPIGNFLSISRLILLQ